jgi:hypothetical protein
MKNFVFLLLAGLALIGCKKNEKINIHITNNRSNIIQVEFRAGSEVATATYVPANTAIVEDAYPGEYDVYVSNWNYVDGVDGPFALHSHGPYYSNDEYLVIN